MGVGLRFRPLRSRLGVRLQGGDAAAAGQPPSGGSGPGLPLCGLLAVLIGWQFVAAEFVGGSIMIVLLVIVGSLWLRGRALSEARERVEKVGDVRRVPDPGDARLHRPLSERLRSRADWSDAAAYAMSDLTMLRKEMIVGFTLAGFLGALSLPMCGPTSSSRATGPGPISRTPSSVRS